MDAQLGGVLLLLLAGSDQGNSSPDTL